MTCLFVFLEKTMNPSDQKMDADELEPEMSCTSGNGSDSTPPRESQTLVIEPSGSGELADGKATGPRTEQGKKRSSRNARKHGVFSEVIVLKGESKAEYEELLTGLRESHQPKGTSEGLLVEKLAANVWRQRRLLLAEGAEIQKNKEFFESDQRDREREEAERIARSSDPLNNYGLIRQIHNPHVLELCWELLFQLRRHIGEHGFKPDFDERILKKIYGDRGENRLREDLYDSYESWLATSEAPEEERLRERYASPGHCQMNIEGVIDAEIVRLRCEHVARASVRTARTQLEIACRNVPDGPRLELLLRYEASLDRSFDRTLNQLERLQRMRLGQPVLPKIDVQLS
jgi:hypothetical protein